MFDLTIPGYVGLFIGAWGVANALSRLTGSLMAGLVRDVVASLTQNAVAAYLVVFGLEAAMLAVAIVMLFTIDADTFHQQVEAPSAVERAALTE
jgi:BCD family chlorophyll transporter-like MFS transporter